MADTGASAVKAGRASSQKSSRSVRSQGGTADEETPLLARDNEQVRDENEVRVAQPDSQAESTLRRSLSGQNDATSKRRRWPSYIALLVLFIFVILIMFFGFFVPAAVKEYATQAVDFRPTRLSLVDLTESGVKVRIQGTFVMDASKVSKKATRDLGRFGTWIAKEAESGQGEVKVYLPQYDNVLAGRAQVPPIKLDIRNGHVNDVDFYTIIEPVSVSSLRGIADKYLDGMLGEVELRGSVEVPLKSGIISLGRQTIEALHTIEGSKLPSIPKYDISKLNIHEANGTKGMAADATITVQNDYPVELNIPAVGFDVMVDNCAPTDPRITIGNASTEHLHVRSESKAKISVSGDVVDLPNTLTKPCPNTNKSPLDVFVETYIHGEDQQIYVKCCNFPEPHTPGWARKLLSDVTVPLPLPGRTFGHLLKSFHLKDVHFQLPDITDPDSSQSDPTISAQIQALVNLPKEMNFALDVHRVRADADVYYKGKKMGKLDLHKWQEANATRVDADSKHGPELIVRSSVEKAPLHILDQDAFTEIVSALIFGRKTLYLEVKALVDVQVNTPVGNFTIPQLPASGKVPVKPIKHGKDVSTFQPQVGNLEIFETTRDSVTLHADVNLTNPTSYSATVPYVNINILSNGTILGQAIAENIHVEPGNNTNLAVKAIWEPSAAGPKGERISRELLSQYLSGYNTTLMFQTHKNTIPALPSLGQALSKFNVTIPTPRLRSPPRHSDPSDPTEPSDPSEGKDDGPHFILSTTMHLFSSTAEFTLLSPLQKSTIYLTWLNATARFHGEEVGKIEYDLPLAVPPGVSTTPRLPVDWDLGSVGFDAVKNALGGTLKLNASAEVGVKIGRWEPKGGLWFEGRGIGAGIRL